MTSIFKLVTERPAEFQSIFTRRQDGKVKISQGELLRIDYCMPGLMFDASGQRVEIPRIETDHIPQELVSSLVTINLEKVLLY